MRFDRYTKLNGDYYEVWLLDRIISKDELWVGLFRREPLPLNEGNSRGCPEGSLLPLTEDRDKVQTLLKFLPPLES